jgi:UDPglucose--hexose-1-phosphate uridylyltransferase
LSEPPPAVQAETDGGECAVCRHLEAELASNERLVLDRDGIVVLAAYGGRLPYELLIAPREHPDGSGFESELLTPALGLLSESLRRLHALEGPVPANSWLHDRGHWHIEVLPRLTVFAGIELGAGIYVNTLAPEDAAAALRET